MTKSIGGGTNWTRGVKPKGDKEVCTEALACMTGRQMGCQSVSKGSGCVPGLRYTWVHVFGCSGVGARQHTVSILQCITMNVPRFD